MGRRSSTLLPGNRDGTSDRGRGLPALDPTTATLDGRNDSDLLTFVQAFVSQLRYWTHEPGHGPADPDAAGLRAQGSWAPFMDHPLADDPKAAIAEIVAYMRDPEAFTGERARWLGRPHFGLLLTFLDLLGQAREHFNGLSERHLDYYYHQVLRFTTAPAVPDRASVIVELTDRTGPLRLPAGTAFDAGRDSAGVPRIYRSERELIVSRAQVAELRSIYVERRVTGIADIRLDRSLTAAEAFEDTLRLALGRPAPGGPIAPWRGQKIDLAFVKGLAGPLGFAADMLGLAHHELRTLMRLVRKRQAGLEWPRINSLLGLPSPDDPRDFSTDFSANLHAAIGVQLDYANDGLPQVDNVDDLYFRRDELDVRQYIETKLANVSFDAFVELMPLKLAVDSDWQHINVLLARAGQRKQQNTHWRFPDTNFDPTDFAANLDTVLDGTQPDWHWDDGSIADYDASLRSLEDHFAMPIERLVQLADFAKTLADDGSGQRAEQADWHQVDVMLAEAHVRAERRDCLALARGSDDAAGFDQVVSFVLSRPDAPPEQAPSWDSARQVFREWNLLDASSLSLLDGFHAQLTAESSPRIIDWPDVYPLLELAWRRREHLPRPVPERIEWRNLYAYGDARACLVDPDHSHRWHTFGSIAEASSEDEPSPLFGWGLRSPLLALSSGTRTLTLTLGLVSDSYDHGTFLKALKLTPQTLTSDKLRAALSELWALRVSTPKGWVIPTLEEVTLADGEPGSDYWALSNTHPDTEEKRPALRLVLRVAPEQEALAAAPDDELPVLQVLQRQRWDPRLSQWTTGVESFLPLRLAAMHLKVEVTGLADLQVQAEDRKLDGRKSFEPFGSQPLPGARLYFSHPELVRQRLDELQLVLEWTGAPENFQQHYENYPGIDGAESFTAKLGLVDRNVPLTLISTSLFESNTSPDRQLVINVPAALKQAYPDFAYAQRLGLSPAEDLRTASRHFVLELLSDFGHARFATLAAYWSGKLAHALSAKLINEDQNEDQLDGYQVERPYTPTVRHLGVSYSASTEFEPGAEAADGPDELVHIHPFGESRAPRGAAGLLPIYDQAGELYIGLRDVDAPQPLALLVQLAEDTSNPDLARAPISWSCLDGDGWRELSVLHDSTRGLLNSGIVELALPAVAASQRLPRDHYWLRAAIPHHPGSVCDCIDIFAQALSVCLQDQGNAADHYEQPLPVGSITALVDPDPRIAKIDQPFTSFGGRPPEAPDRLRTRVSERLRHKQRALSPWDYERLVLQRFPRIYKAKCLAAGHDPGQVAVVVIPDIRAALPGDAFAPRASADRLDDIRAYLQARAPAAATVSVRNARYVPVRVRLAVRFKPDQDERFASNRLQGDVVRCLSPWAFDEGGELMIGGRVYANSILDYVDRLEYVEYVADIKLFRGEGKDDFDLVPSADDYHVATRRRDEILVAARQHDIDVITEPDYEPAAFVGIDHMKIELDFIVGE